MNRILPALLLLLLPAAVPANHVAFQLGRELLAEDRPELAAIEFRRFAMETTNKNEKAAAYLYASYAYLQHRDVALAAEMADRSEEADPSLALAGERTLFDAEGARLIHDTDAAFYYYGLISSDPAPPDLQALACRRAATLHLENGEADAARDQLTRSPQDETAGLRAIADYSSGTGKNPALGGWLGIIPGAGYWYSGEIANGVRCLLLNSLFIYGMAHTAERDEWGAFGIISFFEITWYSGSIYGGIDAAHRYNQRRLIDTVDTIESDMAYRPDPAVTAPVFKLKVVF